MDNVCLDADGIVTAPQQQQQQQQPASTETIIPDGTLTQSIQLSGKVAKRGAKRKAQAKDASVATHCLCGYGDGEMIFCESSDKKCIGQHWYHLECLGIGQRTAPRGVWICPDCKGREKLASSGPGGRQREVRSAAAARSSRAVVADESNYVFEPKAKATKGVLTTASLVKVEAAEHQSRKAMEDMMMDARLLSFDSTGWVLDTRRGGADKGQVFPDGLGKFSLNAENLLAIQSLHRIIVDLLSIDNRLTPWAGVEESDARKRGYAFLPSKFGNFGKNALCAAGVHFHAAEKSSYQAKKDEDANWHSCARLSINDVTEEHMAVLSSIIAAVREAVPDKYRACIALDTLQALQPNLHNGLDHLPGKI
jgi:hypothetical protein